MEYLYISAIIGLCFFNFFAYRRGLKDGLALNQGKPIEPIKSPLESVVKKIDERSQTKEAKAANDAMSTALANLMAYDGSPQLPKEGEK